MSFLNRSLWSRFRTRCTSRGGGKFFHAANGTIQGDEHFDNCRYQVLDLEAADFSSIVMKEMDEALK